MHYNGLELKAALLLYSCYNVEILVVLVSNHMHLLKYW
jgi:hypothetical protein